MPGAHQAHGRSSTHFNQANIVYSRIAGTRRIAALWHAQQDDLDNEPLASIVRHLEDTCRRVLAWDPSAVQACLFQDEQLLSKGRGVPRHRALRPGLLGAATLVVDQGAIRLPVRLLKRGLHAVLPSF
jgi:hypothetical protein